MPELLNDNKSDDWVNPDKFRRTIGKFATGVAVVTSTHQGVHYGMTVSSLTSVSLDPCLLLICPKLGSATGKAIRNSRRFVVNILELKQKELCMRFVGENAKRFEGLSVKFSADGVPLLEGCIAYISCNVQAVHPGGDHEIIVGEVNECLSHPGQPLIYHEGGLLNGFA